MLDFYHDLGVIVRHRNTVVLQAQWLIEVLKQLITIRSFPFFNLSTDRLFSYFRSSSLRTKNNPCVGFNVRVDRLSFLRRVNTKP